MINFIQRTIGRWMCDRLGHVFEPYIYHDDSQNVGTNIKQAYYCRRCGRDKH